MVNSHFVKNFIVTFIDGQKIFGLVLKKKIHLYGLIIEAIKDKL